VRSGKEVPSDNANLRTERADRTAARPPAEAIVV
jgi:hypothetical protein